MGNYASQVPKAESETTVNIENDNGGDINSIDFHGVTLAWTLGIIGFAALAVLICSLYKRQKKANKRALIASVNRTHQQHLQQQEHLLMRAAAQPHKSASHIISGFPGLGTGPIPSAPPMYPLEIEDRTNYPKH